MGYYDIAKLIPPRYRTLILEKNHIFKAVAEFYDKDMMQLWFYYANFIEPDNELYRYAIIEGNVVVADQCKICLGNMLNKWLLMEPFLIQMEQEANLLREL